MSVDTTGLDVAEQIAKLEAEQARIAEQLAGYRAHQRTPGRRELTPEPVGRLYPVHPSRFPGRCWRCWQPPTGGVPECVDPRDGELRHLCRRCYHCLSTGTPITLTEQQRADAWEWLAHQHINQRAADRAGLPLEATGLTDTHIDSALRDLAPHLATEHGWRTVEALEEALLLAQDAEPGAADGHRAQIDEAILVLVGRSS